MHVSKRCLDNPIKITFSSFAHFATHVAVRLPLFFNSAVLQIFYYWLNCMTTTSNKKYAYIIIIIIEKIINLSIYLHITIYLLYIYIYMSYTIFHALICTYFTFYVLVCACWVFYLLRSSAKKCISEDISVIIRNKTTTSTSGILTIDICNANS